MAFAVCQNLKKTYFDGVYVTRGPRVTVRLNAGFRKSWILPEKADQGNLDTCLNLSFLQPTRGKPAIFIMISRRDRVNGIWSRFRARNTEDRR
ncbi:MAG: hypothetical protein CMJ81_22235 [Planctomycetaceae bacterium]|nr:hypothetical protein [Planctomycetaceae bacterium]MBP63212.1 hypothetical protein [Planctomycetaceae bacterium]